MVNDEWERVRELSERQERGEGPGDEATERDRHLYRLIDALRPVEPDPHKVQETLARLREQPVSNYRIYYVSR